LPEDDRLGTAVENVVVDGLRLSKSVVKFDRHTLYPPNARYGSLLR